MAKDLLVDRLLHGAKSVEDVRNPILLPTLKPGDRAIEFAELFVQKREHVDRPHKPPMANAPNAFRWRAALGTGVVKPGLVFINVVYEAF
jgi:hypothetical protein